MKDKMITSLVFGWTILSFLIDLYVAVISKTILSISGVTLISIGLLTCWFAYTALTGKRSGLIVITIFYGLRSFNVHSEHFSFYTRSGLNVEISFGSIVSANLLTLLLFIFLIIELVKKKNASS